MREPLRIRDLGSHVMMIYERNQIVHVDKKSWTIRQSELDAFSADRAEVARQAGFIERAQKAVAP